jgi:hypothetical protein
MSLSQHSTHRLGGRGNFHLLVLERCSYDDGFVAIPEEHLVSDKHSYIYIYIAGTVSIKI